MDRDCDSDESSESDSSNEEDTSQKEDDPRDFTKRMGKIGIISFVLPEGLHVSDEIIDLSECPSKLGMSSMDGYDIENKFNSYSKLKKDLKKNSYWNSALVDAVLHMQKTYLTVRLILISMIILCLTLS